MAIELQGRQHSLWSPAAGKELDRRDKLRCVARKGQAGRGHKQLLRYKRVLPGSLFKISGRHCELSVWEGAQDTPIDSDVYVSLLRQSGNTKALSEGKRLHAHIINCGDEQNRYLGNHLVQMYSKCGAVENALITFSKMQEKNTFTWTIMIGAYVQNGQTKEALQLFQWMQLEGVIPDKVTFVTALSACASQLVLSEGKRLHGFIVNADLESDIAVGNAIVNMYGKSGSMEDAQRFFEKMPVHDVVSWTVMITVYVHYGHGNQALGLFEKMLESGFSPNEVTYISILDALASHFTSAKGRRMHSCIVSSGFESNVLVSTGLIVMYGNCGSLENAQRVFDKMFTKDVISFNAMVAAYAQHGLLKEVLQVFQHMTLAGIVPDEFTFVSIMDACASQASLAEGKMMHKEILERGFDLNLVVGTALVNLYGKCGNLEDAYSIFCKMPEKNVVSWTAMIAAYAQQGQGKEALKLAQKMQSDSLAPDRVTLFHILSACSHSGLVAEGWQFFALMSADRVLEPTLEHYNCVVDLLGRAGKLREAEDLINSMPLEPNAVSWMTLLGACKMHMDIKRGNHAAKRVLSLDPGNATAYILLSNIYASAGRWNDAAVVRNEMNENSAEKHCKISSLIHVRNKVL